ncbi:hypothetical protein D3C72_900510 [compost metagenome]
MFQTGQRSRQTAARRSRLHRRLGRSRLGSSRRRFRLKMLLQHRALENLVLIHQIVQQGTMGFRGGRRFFIERTCLLMSRLLKPVHQPIQLERTTKKAGNTWFSSSPEPLSTDKFKYDG